jgi:hypothetical protein
MIDIVIPLSTGSRHNDLELRYCLRSIEMKLAGVGDIYLVGEKPMWCKNVIHYPHVEAEINSEFAHNIFERILIPPVEDFLFMNDDHYLLDNFYAPYFPYLHRGEIDFDRIIPNYPQTVQMRNTGTNFLDFDIHCPIVYNRRKLLSAFHDMNWPEFGYGIKSMYCKRIGITGSFCNDLKIDEILPMQEIERITKDRKWFSIGDSSLVAGDMKKFLQKTYPYASKYEK